jgi:hypothetical protein
MRLILLYFNTQVSNKSPNESTFDASDGIAKEKIIENKNDHVINEDKENEKPEDSQQQILVEEEKTSNNQDDVSIQVSTFLS